MSVIIGGAGIAGLATSLALAQRGHSSTIYEQSAELGEVGAGLQLGPNAVAVLRTLDLEEGLKYQACAPEAIIVRRIRDGQTISRMRLGAAVHRRYGSPYLTMHRGQLHQLLLRAAQNQPLIRIHTDHTLLLSQADTHCVQLTMHTPDGKHHADGEALLAADGVWSLTRPKLWPKVPKLSYSGHKAYRALIDRQIWPAALTAELASNIGLWLGRGVHVVHYPVAAGSQLNVVVLLESASPISRTGWSERYAPQIIEAEIEMCLRERTRAHMLKEVLLSVPSYFNWPLSNLPPEGLSQHGYNQGRIALLGDAAHPTMPYLSQGAGMALEDAWVIAQELSPALGRPGSAVPHALQRYSDRRMERTQRIVRTSSRNGRIFHAHGLTASARDLYLRLQDGRPVGLPWLYNWKPTP